MKTLWHRLLHMLARKIGLYGTLDSEKALREKNHKIVVLEQRVEQLEQQASFAQRALEETTLARVPAAVSPKGAYDQPSPNTDPALLARLEAQKRKDEMKAFLDCTTSELPAMTGDLTRKYTTRKLKPIKLDPDDAFLL